MTAEYSALVAGAVAMACGHRDMQLEEENKKLWRFQKNGQPRLCIVKNRNKLTMWTHTDQAQSVPTGIEAEARTEGVTRNGAAAIGDNPGMHSNLSPFLGTNELTCFAPSSLDEAWQVLEALG